MVEISHKMTQDEVPICNDIELVCTGESKVVGRSFSDKRRNLLFSSEEKATILNKQMLTDESINIAQNTLKKQFPKIAGLQDIVIRKTQVFDIIRNEQKYIYKYFTQDHFTGSVLPTRQEIKLTTAIVKYMIA